MTHPNEDYYGWAQETLEKLRQGRLSEVNIDDLIEELEDMAKSERRELRNRLAVLLAHLLKWQYQPDRKGKSWQLTIEEQRYQIGMLLKSNPTLEPMLNKTLNEAYPSAKRLAAKETELEVRDFPADCQWPVEQALDVEFYPD